MLMRITVVIIIVSPLMIQILRRRGSLVLLLMLGELSLSFGDEEVLDVPGGPLDVSVGALIVREVISQMASGKLDFVLEKVRFVEEEDERGGPEVPVVDDLLEHEQRFVEAVF